jgi:multidrug efflux system membrane fusion protein
MIYPSFVRAVSALAVLVSFAGCSRSEGEASAAPAPVQPPRVPVAVATVEQRSVPIDLQAIGTAQAYSVVEIRSQVTGELTAVNFKEGEDVRKGQVLFILDRRPLEAALQTARGNLERDTAEAANAAVIAKRQQDLMARGIIAKEQAEQSSTNAAALAATLEAGRGAVASAELQLQHATIVSPFNGRTGQLLVHPGNLVRANDTTPLVTINQVAPIHVSFGVPEARLDELKRYLRQGTLKVEAAPPGAADTGSPGRITFIDNSVDATTGMITVKAEFANQDDRLWPGRFVNVRVTLSTNPNALVVPSVAVQSGQLGDYVFVVKQDESVEYRKVIIDRIIGDRTAIRNGLAVGEKVVTDGQLRLTNGTRVTIKAPAGAAPAGDAR